MLVRRYIASVFGALLATLLAWPAASFAQESPDLVVSLRDAQGHALAASVTVRASAGGPVLARAATNAQGIAVIRSLAVSEVRVLIEGRLPGGLALRQLGDDAAGLHLWLQAGATRLDLRAEPDGVVLPDPATMVVPEGEGAEPVALPSLPPSAPPLELRPTGMPAIGPTVGPARLVEAAPQPVAGFTFSWLLVAGLGLLLVAGLALRGRV